MHRLALAVALIAAAVSSAQARQGGPELEFSGYYKNLLLRSETLLGTADRYWLDAQRLRVELKGRLAENLALDLQYDNELLLGTYLRTAQFAMQKAAAPLTYWDLESSYATGGSYEARHRLYRGSMILSVGETDLRIGRQRIAWGTGRFWSPLDLLNPFSPIAVERAERVGVDAVLVERKFSALSRLSGVYAPDQDRNAPSAALRWHSNARGIDYSLVAGRFRREDVVGADIATQVGGAGVRAELTHNRGKTTQSYRRAVIALDYVFPNTLAVTGELYYNGAGASDRASYDFPALFGGRIQSVGRRYFGGYASYDITPLVKWTNYFVTNLSDHSTFLSPTVTVSLQTDLDLTVGTQLFGGSRGSEYARFRDVHFVQLQWFF